MAGRREGDHFVRHENDKGHNDKGHLGFEVFWHHDGWFWRPLLTLDGEAVGPFTTSTEAYQSAVASKTKVKVRPGSMSRSAE